MGLSDGISKKEDSEKYDCEHAAEDFAVRDWIFDVSIYY
jgi:hypothetical protein